MSTFHGNGPLNTKLLRYFSYIATLLRVIVSVGVTPRTPLFEGKKTKNQKTLLSLERAGFY